MQLSEITRAVRAGEDCIADVAALRGRLRHQTKRGDPGREHDLHQALDAVDDAMKPIRALIGKIPWDPPPSEQEDALRDVSARLQYERKQLKKMRE